MTGRKFQVSSDFGHNVECWRQKNGTTVIWVTLSTTVVVVQGAIIWESIGPPVTWVKTIFSSLNLICTICRWPSPQEFVFSFYVNSSQDYKARSLRWEKAVTVWRQFHCDLKDVTSWMTHAEKVLEATSGENEFSAAKKEQKVTSRLKNGGKERSLFSKESSQSP